MPKLIICKGLPASGKSTWSKAYVKTHPNTVRICRDDLRLMLKDVQFDPKIENIINIAQGNLLEGFMIDDYDIILDATNLNPKYWPGLQEMATMLNYDLEWKDFTDVPLSECILRDSKRPNSVGKKVIQRMHRQFLQVFPPRPAEIPGKPYAIICDIDGTLAHANGRDIYDASKAMDDELDEVIADIVKRHMLHGDTVIFCSGRDAAHSKVTLAWLLKHGLWVMGESVFSYTENAIFGLNTSLLMRPEGDTREDGIVKTELYRKFIEGKYNVRYVLDDRDRVVDAWRDLGLKCLQVHYGDF